MLVISQFFRWAPYMFAFTSLVPPEQLDHAAIRALLLSFDDSIRILADPGWDVRSDLSHLESIMSSVDLILLSHPTMAFMGAYAYLYKTSPVVRSIPVYSTAPVVSLGRVTTIEMYRAGGVTGPVTNHKLEVSDIENAFDRISLLKHSQSTTLRGKFDRLTITAMAAGHTLGGVIWILLKDTERIVYAPAWNHSRDSYLEGARMLGDSEGAGGAAYLRPSVFITSSMVGSNMGYNKRVEKFLGLVNATLQNSGTVLLPVLLGSRLLELVHLIDDHLRSLPYQVFLLARTGTRALTYAGSMLEWMSPAVTKEWQVRGKAPFEASTVTVINYTELSQYPGSKVVFCCDEGLDQGSVSFEAFMKLCNDVTTTVLLTEKAERGTLAYQLYQYWEKEVAKRNHGKVEDGFPVPYEQKLNINTFKEEQLTKSEIEEYTKWVKEQRDAEKKLKQQLEKKVDVDDTEEGMLKITSEGILNSDDEDDEDDEEEEAAEEGDDAYKRAEKVKKANKENEENLKENLPLDIDVRAAKGKNRMFPYMVKRVKFDDYGEVINVKEFQLKDGAVEGGEGGAGGSSNIGEKRSFDSLTGKKLTKKKKDDEELLELNTLHQPRKRVASHVLKLAKCGLAYVELAGLVDVRSFCRIIPTLKPRKLLLMNDLTDPRNFGIVYNQLNSIISNRRGTGSSKMFDLIEVKDNQEIDIGSEITSYEVLLDDALSNTLKWQKITGGYTIAHVMGKLVKRNQIKSAEEKAEEEKEGKIEEVAEPEEGKVKAEPDEKTDLLLDKDVDMEDGEAKAASENMDKQLKEGFGLVPVSESQMLAITNTPLAIGDIKLAELKEMYNGSEDHQAELVGDGALVIDNIICVRKISSGDLVIEGHPCKLFYDVRTKVRAMLAYV